MEANYDFGHRQVSYGHWEIECQVIFYNTVEFFKYTTTDSEFIDKVVELKAEGGDAQKAYSDFVLPYIGEQIEEWCDLVKYGRLMQWASREYLTEEIPIEALRDVDKTLEFIRWHVCEAHKGKSAKEVWEEIQSLASSGMRFFRNHFKVN